MDPKTYEQNAPKPPLIAQIPPAISQMPMLPQHVITSGTEKNCIRLRGLPYEAKVEHILHFLEDFAKNIVYQGVHLVYNSQVSWRKVKLNTSRAFSLLIQGQFNGEAFIQMDSEQAAQASAQQKHHKHMMFGKKQRYIEVFQCSGEDMNVVLNGGGYQYPSPPAISAKPLASPGMLSSRPQQPTQPLQISIAPPMPLSLPQSNVLQNSGNASSTVVGGASNSRSVATSLMAQQQQAHFIAQQNLFSRQQAAVAAAQLQAVQQQSDPMAFFQNVNFLQSPGGSAGVNPGVGGNPYSFPFAPQIPQFYFMPRPLGLPMGLMPSASHLSHMQYPGMHGSAAYAPSALQNMSTGGGMSGAAGAGQQQASQLSSSTGKRSYENAFRNDPLNAQAAVKRAYHQNPNAANIYGSYPYSQL